MVGRNEYVPLVIVIMVKCSVDDSASLGSEEQRGSLISRIHEMVERRRTTEEACLLRREPEPWAGLARGEGVEYSRIDRFAASSHN